MGLGSLIVLLIVGAVAGWLASNIVKGRGQGFVANVVVGILGAFIAALILPRIGFGFGGGLLAQILQATIGAVILLVALRLIRRG